jgi:two-component system cell cycle sensor histidine kinase/response regulator CckA
MVEDAARAAVVVAGSDSIAAAPPDAIIRTTSSGELSSINAAAVLLFGYDADELIGQNVDVLLPPGSKAVEAEIMRRITAGEDVRPYRADRVRRDGTIVTVVLSSSPIVDSTGAVIGAATVSHLNPEQQVIRDRFETRVDRLQADIREAQDRFRTGMDAERARERVEVQDAEDRFQARMDTERARERVKGNDAQEEAQVQQAEDLFQTRMDTERARERKYVQDAEDRFQTRMDAERAKERVQVQDAEDRFQLGIDAERAKAQGDREKLQGHLEQSQRLEVLGQLAGGVAHDFNNVLAVILNYAEFVAGELAARPGSGLESAANDVAEIQRAAERATALTHQLLAFARREVIQPRVLDLNQIVANVEQLLRRTLGEDLVLLMNRAEDLGPVLADPGQIEQILVNLAVNARDAMSGGGILTIDTANIVVDADFIATGSALRAGRHVRLRVGDTGTGMPADVAEHAFEPFYTTKSDGRGTGLGLATVYGIVIQAAGAITINSQPGVGTTFTILIPVTDERPEPVMKPAAYERTPRGETVLVVEDEQALREVTKRIFTRSGYHVLAAADGGEAIALVARYDGEIHLLVTDVVMPRMLGKEVAEKISALRPNIAVLYMSGYAQPVLASQGRLDPGIVLIEKPFSATSLIEAAGRVLNGHFDGFRTISTGDATSSDRGIPSDSIDPPPTTRE